MQINRLLEIVYVLLRQKTITARELAQRFGVSQRTIYRDVDALSLAGIPVYTEKGKGGGISLLPDFVLNKSLLSEAEQTEILSALQGLPNLKTAETGQVLQKLSTLFNKTAVPWLEVDLSDWSFSNGGLFNDFKAAILARRIVEFDYHSSYGIASRRRVEPLQLWFKHKAWYIKAFCLGRQDLRLFKLSRVRRLSLTEEHFEERDLLAYPPSPSPGSHPKQDVTLQLKIAPEMAYRVYDEFDEDLAELLPDGSFLVTVTWPEDAWVYGTILSYGPYAQVLEPAHLREIIREMAMETANQYS